MGGPAVPARHHQSSQSRAQTLFGSNSGRRDQALVVGEKIEPLERLYRLRGGREHRLDALYRLVQEHRANLGTLLPATAEQVQDAEFSEVEDETDDADQLSQQ